MDILTWLASAMALISILRFSMLWFLEIQHKHGKLSEEGFTFYVYKFSVYSDASNIMIFFLYLIVLLKVFVF